MRINNNKFSLKAIIIFLLLKNVGIFFGSGLFTSKVEVKLRKNNQVSISANYVYIDASMQNFRTFFILLR